MFWATVRTVPGIGLDLARLQACNVYRRKMCIRCYSLQSLIMHYERYTVLFQVMFSSVLWSNPGW